MRVVGAAHRKAAISCRADRNLARRVISDVSVDVGIHHVLPRRIQLRKCALEFFPVLRRIHVKEWDAQSVVERPAQRQRPRFARNQFRDDRSVTRDLHVHGHVRLALDVDHLDAMFRLHPSRRSLIRALRVEILDVNVGHGWTDVGESPRDSLVVAHDHIRHAGQRHPGNVESARVQVRLVPQVRHLVAEVHIIREQWLSGDGVRSGNHPVVRSVHRQPLDRQGVRRHAWNLSDA